MQVANQIIQTINSLKINSNSVIIYDIDGTLLDHYGNGVSPIIQTYHHAKNKGLTPVIITARTGSDENINRTKEQLYSQGVIDYKYMYFMPQYETDQALYKLFARKNLHERGYDVKISIGDMPWDIGAYGGIGFQI